MMKVDGSEVYYEVAAALSNELLVISAQDITQQVRYNTLIAEERGKSDQMLASILPPSLVRRVQEGEKNISFAVQSASISFLDIVEFTPWCGSLDAATVMSTLNSLFKKFDEAVGRRAILTKIKCIGDCYVCAGGIFSEINQPAVHAKDMVSFGLDAIQALEELNQEVDQHLRIRAGVNTGGPIVAGVLGVGKPTFEILGPTINLAQQMEHHGVPMLVHVTRAVYELIYGDATFQVKERGATQISSGTVITYLVTPKK
jgi:class 3 adenylate cyclase